MTDKTPTDLLEAVRRELDGIDRMESDDPPGWWETSTGAAFGAGRLAAITAALPAAPPDKLACGCTPGVCLDAGRAGCYFGRAPAVSADTTPEDPS